MMAGGVDEEYRVAVIATLFAITLLATVLRLAYLDRPSLFYDEVIVMQLATQPDPAALLRRLPELDATRAPLHPLLLQGWLALFGASPLAGRAFSVLCGVLDRAGGRADRAAGPSIRRPVSGRRFLCAISPMQVRYAQEVRMYALLVLETCLAWDLLFSFRDSAAPAQAGALTSGASSRWDTRTPWACSWWRRWRLGYLVGSRGLPALAAGAGWRSSSSRRWRSHPG